MTPQDRWLSQKERILAWFRLGFAIVAVLIIQLNPSRVINFPLLTYAALASFAIYSIGVLLITSGNRTPLEKIGIAATCFDLMWVSLIVFSTGGTATPFFVFYSFPIISAGSRYGIQGGLVTALGGIVLYGFVRFGFVWESLLGIDRFIVRSVYLAALAYFVGFLSEFESKQNQRLLALSKTAGEVAAMAERRRITRDVHDGLLQTLATQILRFEICRRQLVNSPQELDTELRSMEEDTRNSMKVIRQFLSGKEVKSFPTGMLLEKLKEDLKFLRDGLGLRVVLEAVPPELNLSEAVEQDLYLMLREGLMNIARHSHASHADVTLTQTESEIRGSLADDGVGFEPNEKLNGRGVGLTSMKERIEQLGGELVIQSSPGSGARVSFVLPFVTENDKH